MLRDELIYGIWLQKCLGVNNKRLHKALEMFETPEELYRASERDIRLVGFFSDHEIINLINKNTERCEKVLSDCESLGIKAVCIGQPEYPEMLSEIATPPIMLYIKGNMPAQNRFHAAVVGTRYPADSSKRLAFSFGYDLAKASAVVVSGGAIGIDSFAHRGAVESGGSSIMVLGCGIDCFHSISTESFIDKLVINGALVSEYPPGVSPEKYHFPMRNRIITGLSHCCAVVQAGIGSGAMIAARCAVSQRRTLFAVPGTVENPKFAGSNLLLRNGFKAVLCADDILRWYQYSHGKYAEAIDIENNPSLKMELTGKFEPALGEIQSDGKRSIKQPPGYILCTMVENISHGGKITDISDYLCRNELTNPETQRIVSFSEYDSDEEQYDSEPSPAGILPVPEKQELSAVNEIPEPDAEPVEIPEGYASVVGDAVIYLIDGIVHTFVHALNSAGHRNCTFQQRGIVGTDGLLQLLYKRMGLLLRDKLRSLDGIYEELDLCHFEFPAAQVIIGIRAHTGLYYIHSIEL